MNQIRETISNYSPDPSSEYCRRLVREQLSRTKSNTEEVEELGAGISLTIALSYTTAEQRIADALCSSFLIPEEEFKIWGGTAYGKIRTVVPSLRSSKEYSPTRTSPVVNKLNEIWLISAAGFRGFVDINRVHRNFFYDISSSDSVEDYIIFKSPDKSTKVPVIPDLQLSPEAAAFCKREGILQYLPVGVDLIRRSFHAVGEIATELEADPETEEEWLSIGISVQGEVEEVIKNYERYIGEWVSSIPWPERHKIRLSYNIL
jgi:hypothetical protein